MSDSAQADALRSQAADLIARARVIQEAVAAHVESRAGL